MIKMREVCWENGYDGERSVGRMVKVLGVSAGRVGVS